ncbi:MAG: hypothetical protein AAFN92_21765, partial [Bacteroidota bacterium]
MKTDLTKMGQLLAIVFFSCSLVGLPSVGAQCLTPELLMINSCIEHTNPNGGPLDVESEFLVASTGLEPVAVNTIRLDVPFDGLGPENADLSEFEPGDCRFKVPTVTSLPGCANSVILGPVDEIPANAFVVIFINGATTTEDVMETDFSNLCPRDAPIYILQSECERSAGAFANEFSGGDPTRLTRLTSPCRTWNFSYSTNQISAEEGTYYLIGNNTSDNLDCDLPEIPETCPSIDTSYFICDETGTMDQVPIAE